MSATEEADTLEYRNRIYSVSGTVRGFEVGQTFTLTQHPVHSGTYVVLGLSHQGVNNLPAELSAIAQQISSSVGIKTLGKISVKGAGWGLGVEVV